jgi:hypothetical protein
MPDDAAVQGDAVMQDDASVQDDELEVMAWA